MAGAKEIRSKIASVQNTQKITKAMEMVAASKMRKSQDRMAASRPYAETMRKVIGHLAHGNLEYKHPYLEDRDVKRVGYLVVSTDRGLCGGLNINLFKKLLAEMKTWTDKGVQCDLAMIGSKGVSFFNSVGGNVVAQVTGMARVLLHFSDAASTVHFRRGIWELRKAIVTGILSIGMAPCLVNVCGSAVTIAINRQLADHGGDLAIGAYGIINRILILFAMLVIGLTQGMQPIIGYNHGAMKPGRVLLTLKYGVLAGTSFTTLGFCLLYTSPSPRD